MKIPKINKCPICQAIFTKPKKIEFCGKVRYECPKCKETLIDRKGNINNLIKI